MCYKLDLQSGCCQLLINSFDIIQCHHTIYVHDLDDDAGTNPRHTYILSTGHYNLVLCNKLLLCNFNFFYIINGLIKNFFIYYKGLRHVPTLYNTHTIDTDY